MSEDGSGGVRALRMWARDAIERADRVIPFTEVEWFSRMQAFAEPGFIDRTIEELTHLEPLLPAPDDPRNAVLTRLGVLLALRYAGPEGGSAEDRTRGLAYLGQVRSAEPRATDWERQGAAFGLLALRNPRPELGRRDGRPADHAALMDWYIKDGGAFQADDLPELFADARALPLPTELRQQLDQAGAGAALLSHLLRPGGPTATAEEVIDAFPADFPLLSELRAMLNLRDRLNHREPATETSTTPEPTTEPDAGPARGRARVLSHLESVLPGALSADLLREMQEELARGAADPALDPEDRATDAVVALLPDAMNALRGNDPALLHSVLGRLAEVADILPEGHRLAPVLTFLRAAYLGVADRIGGNRQDAELGARLLEAVEERFTEGGVSPVLTPIVRLLSLESRFSRAEQAADPAALDGVIDELLSLRESVATDPDLHYLTVVELALAQLARGDLLGDAEERHRALALLEEAERQAGNLHPVLQEAAAQLAGVRKLGRGPDEDPALIDEVLSVPRPRATGAGDWELQQATARLARHTRTGDRADLDAAIAALEGLRERTREGRGTTIAVETYWRLAEAYADRADLTEDPEDQRAAVASAVESLRAHSADVLLEAGAEDGLLAARRASERGLLVARWAAVSDLLPEAVEALELGRAMVLQAAADTADLPERLAARGAQELAEAWRAAAAGAPAGAGLPSDLRRRALEALGYRQGVSGTPTLDELCAALDTADTDLLVYLVPGDGEQPGLGIVLGPAFGVQAFLAPALSDAQSGPLHAYLDAAAARSGQQDAEADRAWQEALAGLCDWAWLGVMGPLHELGTTLRAADPADPAPPRVVLVPCGRLGVVPWHAARVYEGGRYRYACERLLLSYAASGRQLLRAVERRPIPVESAPVLLADPRLDLLHAEREVAALHADCYPNARLFGEYYDPPAPPSAAGTPAEVLALLTTGQKAVSLLHVASHGSAGPRPTESALVLARPVGTAPGPTVASAPDAGLLTVAQLLDGEGLTARPAGPLVVLSACETDLSTRDHDEALTLTTAFLARGARNVVGSRWTTADGASAVMMAVFHHHLTVARLDPAHALQATQRWMLDPKRRLPTEVRGLPASYGQLPGLHRPEVWAAFIHQGHPGPAPVSLLSPPD
ncbi:hypothetical protein CFP65_0834 [Kitasatospora sp. MMS16-BH015]|uniref:CHAT domain-containing protein n=1 Tax=Kitasatospora sp. MMS16-BH015 TaxID=2018025 RepID=UPI000CA3DB31|nr:CHAT domain-containing protein [Kitasatospora sp. MMS16-BH015]AUG75764.1 hypothetical protein CFP65_0834 [Kitasatospora sp. MMS16-BH015]